MTWNSLKQIMQMMSNRVGSWVILLLVVVIRQEKNRLRSLTLWCLLSQTPSLRTANLRVWKDPRRTRRWNWKLSYASAVLAGLLRPADRRRKLKIRTKKEKKQTGCRSIHNMLARRWNGWMYWTEEMMQSGRKIREQKFIMNMAPARWSLGLQKHSRVCVTCSSEQMET